MYTVAPLEYFQSVLIIGLSVFEGLKMFNTKKAICALQIVSLCIIEESVSGCAD